MSHFSITRHTQRSGQALTEFIIVFPLMVLLVFGVMQIGQKMHFDQRAESLIWYPLRGASYGWMHQTQSLSGIQTEIKSLFPENVNATFSVDTASSGAIEALSTFSILNPTDVSLVREVDLSITYPNIFRNLKVNFEDTNFGELLNTSDKWMTSSASGWILVSWTAIAHKPAISKQDMDKYKNMSDPNKYKNAVQKQKEALAQMKQKQAYWQQQYEYYSTSHIKRWTTRSHYFLCWHHYYHHQETVGPWPDKAAHAQQMEQKYAKEVSQMEKLLGGE